MSRQPLSASVRGSLGARTRSISSIMGFHASTARPQIKIINSQAFNTNGRSSLPLPSLNDSKEKSINQTYNAYNNVMPISVNKELTARIMSLHADVHEISLFAMDASPGDSFKQIADDTAHYLYDLVGQIIFRNHDDMTYLDQYNDDPFIREIVDWRDLKNIYGLLQNMITDCWPRVTLDWLMNKNAELIFHNLLSPDPREVSFIESLILNIFKTWSDISVHFVKAASAIIQNFIDGLHSFYGIPSVLKFLDLYFRTCQSKWDDSMNDMVVKQFIPIFLHNFAYKYYPSLNRILSYAYTKNDQLAVTVLCKMLRCWPITCSSNVVCFIHHFSSIVTLVGPVKISPYVVQMFNKIIESVKSDNHKISVSALTISCNVTFIFEFLTKFSSQVRSLYSAAEDVSVSHWSEEARSSAKQAIISINNAAPQLKLLPPPVVVNNIPEKLSSWKNLSQQFGIELVGTVPAY